MWAEPGRWFAPGRVEIDAAGRITAVGPDADPDPPARALFPGLVNAHVHLQIAPPARPTRAFLPWLREVIAGRAGDPHAVTAAAEQQTEAAIRTLVVEGCTAVGEIDSLGTSPAILARRNVGGRCYQEVVGFGADRVAAAQILERRHRRQEGRCASGVSPHAPYSCSAELIVAAGARAPWLAIHVAESTEESELLVHGTGPFRRLLEDLGKWPAAYRAPGLSPIAWLDAIGVLSAQTLLIHAQHATPADIELVAARRAPIVVCPSTIEYFGRRPPDIGAWRRAGVRVALGTDSAASREGPLSMRTEMAVACRLWPALSPEEVLAAATVEAAAALGLPELGRIAMGAPADLCSAGLPAGMAPEAAVAAFVAGRLPSEATWLQGRPVPQEGQA